MFRVMAFAKSYVKINVWRRPVLYSSNRAVKVNGVCYRRVLVTRKLLPLITREICGGGVVQVSAWMNSVIFCGQGQRRQVEHCRGTRPIFLSCPRRDVIRFG